MERKYSIVLILNFILAILFFHSCAHKEEGISEDIEWSDSFGLEDTKLIWKEKHAAFTSLIKFNNKYFVAFRVGEKHVSSGEIENGYIRVLVSDNLSQWDSIDSLTYNGDLRDPFFSISPQNELLMLCGVNQMENGKIIHDKTVLSSFDKKVNKFRKFSDVIMDDNTRPWLWKIRWCGKTAWGFAYKEGLTPLLMKSTDAKHWTKICSLPVSTENIPSEVDLAFIDKEEMIVVVRNDNGRAVIGRAMPPYLNWKIEPMGIWIGSPNLLVNSHYQLFLTYRLYGNGGIVNFTFSMLDTMELKLIKSLNIFEGSYYDMGYGSSILVDNGKSILTSYYIAGEDNAGIYIAKISTK